MKTSPSSYLGRPLSVFRVIDGSSTLQPRPNGVLPAPESYDSASWGPKPERPGLAGRGMVSDPVPVTGLAETFSPIPRTAPPPLGSVTAGGAGTPAGAPGARACDPVPGALEPPGGSGPCSSGLSAGPRRSLRDDTVSDLTLAPDGTVRPGRRIRPPSREVGCAEQAVVGR